MEYQFLHGNVREMYSTVLNTIPGEWQSQIPPATERLLEYGVHGDPQHHSMLPIETAEGLKILRSLCVRKQNAYSPSYYVHKQVLTPSPLDLLERFEEILTLPFYSEKEFDSLAQGASYVEPSVQWQGQGIRFSKDVLRAILRGMVCHWRSGGELVVVEVPGDVDYNRYCMGAIRVIYSYLPAGIRAQAGFMTYTAPGSITNQVVLAFQPAGVDPNSIRLDMVTEQSQAFMDATLPESLRKMLDNLVNATEEQRNDYLKRLWDCVETDPESRRFVSKLGSKQYTSYLEHQDILDVVDTQEKFDQQLEFFRNPKALSQRMQTLFYERVNSRISKEAFFKFALAPREEDGEFHQKT